MVTRIAIAFTDPKISPAVLSKKRSPKIFKNFVRTDPKRLINKNNNRNKIRKDKIDCNKGLLR